jgi:endonuclease YncB( thermonuclease family)
MVLMLALLAVWPAFGEGWFANGTVRKVSDGDSLTLDTGDGEQIEVRLYGVDCPESAWSGRWPAQPRSAEATKFTSRLVLNQPVTVRFTGEQTYGRAVGEVFVDGSSVSRELVRFGMAWWNRKHADWDHDLKRLEKQARQKKLGIWTARDPVPPWEHRRKHGR